ncbi:hypothetical protein KDA_14340 [Dictyobacter alpinus]|uniref:Uncharacterized protein n=1 Tax=Dictyobacter alpinus TaxID=2014873 RepID=A0A402B3M3_9CHLR|nr:hypothetical protein KDA_14340 [Dictyobacter alpinus]
MQAKMPLLYFAEQMFLLYFAEQSLLCRCGKMSALPTFFHNDTTNFVNAAGIDRPVLNSYRDKSY